MASSMLRPARVNPVVRHPREERVSLDGQWRFRLEPEAAAGGKRGGGTGCPRLASLRERIRVPGCWQGQGFGHDGRDKLWDFALEARVFRATSKGTGWYGRMFSVPAAWTGKRVWLNFGGAHPSAEVWLNGVRLGENDLPFVPFAFDITDVVRRDRANELVVRIHEKHREFGLAFSWQGNWSGLYRGVELSATGPCWLERCALLPDTDSATLKIRLAMGAVGGNPLQRVVPRTPFRKLLSVANAARTQTESDSSRPSDMCVQRSPARKRFEKGYGEEPLTFARAHCRPSAARALRALLKRLSATVSQNSDMTLAVRVTPNVAGAACLPSGRARSRSPDRSGPATLRAEFAITDTTAEFAIPVPTPSLWSPDTPNLYRVDLVLKRGDEICDVRSERVGFVKLEACGKQFCINGEPYYLRGSGDFISCPETGCPDTNRDRWRRKLRALRAYGYNYVRCQSYVYGPEYYDVADEVGLLVQSEMGMLGGWGGSSCWHVYQWPKPTPDNYPILKEQWDLVVERDVCHPSANLYCMSNELGKHTDFPKVAWECYRDTKARKPTAQVIWTDGGLNLELPGDFVNQFVDRYVGGGTKREDQEKIDKPFVQHEFMWWSSFPDVRLRRRYRGAVRPYAAEIATASAARHGQTHLLERYADTSQRLQLLEAKAKMEGMRRDFPTLAGICHFNAMDANPSPQGIITEFYECKLADSAEWQQTNGDTVVLCSLGFDDRCRAAGETVKVNLFVSDFAHPPLRAPRLAWRVVAGDQTLASGEIAYAHQPFQTCAAGEIAFTVSAVTAAQAARLEVVLREGTREVRNRWDLWLFPAATEAPAGVAVYGNAARTWVKEWKTLPAVTAEALRDGTAGRVVLTEQLDAALVAFMQTGGRVILAAGEGLVRPHHALFGYVKYFFTPPANYAPYEDGQNGTVIQQHPLLGDVPHEGFADWQFFRLIENAPPIDLEPLGLADNDPVIRVIHRYPVLHPLGYLVERRCGRGGLILTALDLRPEFAEARHLLAQFCRHAESANFLPAQELAPASLARLLTAGELGSQS